MKSSNGNIFRVTGPLCGELTGHRWIPHTKASNAELWFFSLICLNKRLSKQSRGWWFETPSRSLWRHCNDDKIMTWEHFPCDWPFLWGNLPVTGGLPSQRTGALMFSLIYAWTNGWTDSGIARDFDTPWRSWDVTLMMTNIFTGTYLDSDTASKLSRNYSLLVGRI